MFIIADFRQLLCENFGEGSVAYFLSVRKFTLFFGVGIGSSVFFVLDDAPLVPEFDPPPRE